MLLRLVFFVIGAPIMVESQTIKEDVNGPAKGISYGYKKTAEDVSSLVKQIISSYMEDCYVMLFRDGNSLISDAILRSLSNAFITEVLVEVDNTTPDDLEERHLMDNLRQGEDRFPCRVILLDTTGNVKPSSALLLLENMQLFLIPNAYVIFLGSKLFVEDTLMDHALRNTINALFLAIQNEGGTRPMPSLGEIVRYGIRKRQRQMILSNLNNTDLTSVAIHSRCLYCHGGQMGIVKIDEWNSKDGYSKGNNLILDQLHDFMGHQISIVSLDWYPMIDFIRDSDEVSTTVTPQDSVDMRLLIPLARTLNFTYEMRVPWDNKWGTTTNTGDWTGTIGTLQHHEADMSMHISMTWGRSQVIDYSRVYSYESLVMVMSKPRPLPPYLALIRPMEGTLWGAIFLSSVCAGIILWTLQLGWMITSGERGLSLDRSVLFTWSILFEEPPKNVPKNISSQMFVGWWWLYCTLIAVVYKSSLIAHLSIPAMSKPIGSFDELFEANGWTVGYEPIYGSGWEWFKGNDNPTVKGLFERMEVFEFKEQMLRVLTTQHVLISWEFIVYSRIAADFTDRFGYTQAHIVKSDSLTYGGGWGFRKNYPAMRPIDKTMQRLIETGCFRQWMDGLMITPSEKNRNKELQEEVEDKTDESGLQTSQKEPHGLLVLSVHHLQSVFYVMFLGVFFSVSAFIGENLVVICKQNSFQHNIPA